MASFDIHKEKYTMFKRDAENEENSIPTRIEAYFNASFHLIESRVSKFGIHIDKHQNVRTILEKNHQIFRDDTEQVWRAFQEIENQIRPGQIYGGAINGKKLSRTIELFWIIETICGKSE
ncbi:MAG: hypothetical protein AB1629_07730 [Candidatus Omnitrophota bacterium]